MKINPEIITVDAPGMFGDTLTAFVEIDAVKENGNTLDVTVKVTDETNAKEFFHVSVPTTPGRHVVTTPSGEVIDSVTFDVTEETVTVVEVNEDA